MVVVRTRIWWAFGHLESLLKPWNLVMVDDFCCYKHWLLAMIMKLGLMVTWFVFVKVFFYYSGKDCSCRNNQQNPSDLFRPHFFLQLLSWHCVFPKMVLSHPATDQQKSQVEPDLTGMKPLILSSKGSIQTQLFKSFTMENSHTPNNHWVGVNTPKWNVQFDPLFPEKNRSNLLSFGVHNEYSRHPKWS